MCIALKTVLLMLLMLCVGNAVPILPIITAIAGSASNILNVDIDVLGIAKWMKESTKTSNFLIDSLVFLNDGRLSYWHISRGGRYRLSYSLIH